MSGINGSLLECGPRRYLSPSQIDLRIRKVRMHQRGGHRGSREFMRVSAGSQSAVFVRPAMADLLAGAPRWRAYPASSSVDQWRNTGHICLQRIAADPETRLGYAGQQYH